jgi:hypothetical protein
LECTEEEAKYISQPSETLERNRALKCYFEGRENIVIIDAFACVGGDSISLMSAFKSCKLHSVQRTETAEERGRFTRLVANTGNAIKHVASSSTCTPYANQISSAIKQIETNTRDSGVDLLFLDPPWFDRGEKLDLDDMVYLLQKNVFDPMKAANLKPNVICMKVDFTIDALRACQRFKNVFSEYGSDNTVNVMRNPEKPPVYYFHIFQIAAATPLAGDVNPVISRFLNNLTTTNSKLDSVITQLMHNSNRR